MSWVQPISGVEGGAGASCGGAGLIEGNGQQEQGETTSDNLSVLEGTERCVREGTGRRAREGMGRRTRQEQREEG